MFLKQHWEAIIIYIQSWRGSMKNIKTNIKGEIMCILVRRLHRIAKYFLLDLYRLQLFVQQLFLKKNKSKIYADPWHYTRII
jgi:hypothetical protein